jgi:hypothetical protein
MTRRPVPLRLPRVLAEPRPRPLPRPRSSSRRARASSAAFSFCFRSSASASSSRSLSLRRTALGFSLPAAVEPDRVVEGPATATAGSGLGSPDKVSVADGVAVAAVIEEPPSTVMGSGSTWGAGSSCGSLVLLRANGVAWAPLPRPLPLPLPRPLPRGGAIFRNEGR